MIVAFNRFTFLFCFCFLLACTKQPTAENIDCSFASATINRNPSILTKEQDEKYFNFWKEKFLQFHGLSEEDFSEKISEYYISSSSWGAGISFQVDYKVKLGWAQVHTKDKFIVKLNGANSSTHNRGVPLDEFLEPESIDKIFDLKIFNNGITPINFAKKMKYQSCEEAVRAFRGATGIQNMKVDRVSFFVPGMLPREDGDPYLIGSAEINAKKNKCGFGKFNLFSGAHTSDRGPCEIF